MSFWFHLVQSLQSTWKPVINSVNSQERLYSLGGIWAFSFFEQFLSFHIKNDETSYRYVGERWKQHGCLLHCLFVELLGVFLYNYAILLIMAVCSTSRILLITACRSSSKSQAFYLWPDSSWSPCSLWLCCWGNKETEVSIPNHRKWQWPLCGFSSKNHPRFEERFIVEFIARNFHIV